MNLRKLFLFCIIFLGSISSFSQETKQNQSFAIGEESFLLNGNPFVVRCGEMHFARIPKEYWQHRLQMAKAMGLNTVCEYLFWNLHEPQPGQFNWEGIADAAEFCRLAQKEGLYVILRPGPYSCAEWEFGGFPWWLLKDNDLKLRTQDAYYLEQCRIYLHEVGRMLAPLQISNGGPIIMVQVENEYGSYGNDKEYIGKLRDYLVEGGFNVPLFTCDGPSQLKNDVRNDIFCVVNFGDNPEENFKALREIRPKGPLMCGEYYPGWFDSWGSEHHTGEVKTVTEEIKYMLDHKASFSIYMAHGGTTFGQWSGANSPPFSPQTSSYDYDAPISEAGWVTPKYTALRKLFSGYLQPGEILPDIPKQNPVITIPEFELKESASVFANLPQFIEDKYPRNMEAYDQGYGCILYRTKMPETRSLTLILPGLHDYALVFLNGKKFAILNRMNNDTSCYIPSSVKGDVLDILVEAMGRINYGRDLHDRKGINGIVRLRDGFNNTTELTNWQVYPIRLGNDEAPAGLKFEAISTTMPAFYRGSFTLKKTGDTFLDMSSWGKGLVWVNGHCLGRYWNIGPTETMYLPGPWLKAGINEVIVLDYLGPKKNTLQGLEAPILDYKAPEPQ
jgi:beta-galactosidase